MSNRPSTSRLRLNGETVRELTPGDLDGAAGGVTTITGLCAYTLPQYCLPTLAQPCVFKSGLPCQVTTHA